MYIYIYIYLYIYVYIAVYVYIYVYIYIYIYIYINNTDTAQIVLIHITSVVKLVHIFMATDRISKSYLMTELCIPRLCILVVLRYILSGFTTSSVLAIRRNSLLGSTSPRCLVALMTPYKTKCVCYSYEMARQ